MSLEAAQVGLVEDDPIMGESLVQRLVLEGAGVTWWRSKADAVRGIQSGPLDLVVCDIKLPDGNGEDVFRTVRSAQRTLPFLFMTAYADIDQAVRLMKAGAGDYITKPFEIAQLLQRMRLLVSEQGLQSAPASLRDARGNAEKTQIERALLETGGRIGEAAKRLGVSRTTLWARIKALGLEQNS